MFNPDFLAVFLPFLIVSLSVLGCSLRPTASQPIIIKSIAIVTVSSGLFHVISPNAADTKAILNFFVPAALGAIYCVSTDAMDDTVLSKRIGYCLWFLSVLGLFRSVKGLEAHEFYKFWFSFWSTLGGTISIGLLSNLVLKHQSKSDLEGRQASANPNNTECN